MFVYIHVFITEHGGFGVTDLKPVECNGCKDLFSTPAKLETHLRWRRCKVLYPKKPDDDK